MQVRRGRLWIAVLAACVTSAFAAPAQAADPARTLTAISGSYDVATGTVRATATLAAPPTLAQDAGLVIYAGEFALRSQTLGSWGTPGTPGSGNFASVPPDRKGTYEVLPRGKLRLTYADGDVADKTIGIYRDAQTGSADPAKDGLWLDDEPYWKDDEDQRLAA